MLTAAIDGPRSASLINVPEPRLRPGWSLVDVAIAPLCTEFAAYAAGAVGHTLGHEAVGVVRETTDASALRVGQRVVAMPLLGCGRCRLCIAGDYIHCPYGAEGQEPLGTLQQVICKPDRLLIPIPDELADADAALACCALGASFGAFERSQVSATDTVLVTGLGPVGLGAVAHAVMRGCRVIAIESHPCRAALATSLGAETVLPPSEDAAARAKELTGGTGPDVAIECSGVVGAQRLCIETVRRRGEVAFVGNSYTDTPLRVSPDLIFTGLTVYGSWHYNLASAPRLLGLIARHPSLVRRLVTHRFPLEEIATAWETQLSGECGKVLIEMPAA